MRTNTISQVSTGYEPKGSTHRTEDMSEDGSATRLSSKIKKFNGENWKKWSDDLKATLRGAGLWKTIEPGTGPALNADDATKDAWERKVDMAYAIVWHSIEDDVQRHITFTEDPKAAYEALKAEYVVNSLPARLRIKGNLRETLGGAEKSGSMRKWLADLEDLYLELEAIGAEVDEHERCIEVFEHLPEAYHIFVKTEKDITKWPILRSRLLEEERAIKKREARLAGTTQPTQAFAALSISRKDPATPDSTTQETGQHFHPAKTQLSGRGGHAFGGGRGRGGRGFRGGPFLGLCTICRTPGHKMINCPHRARFEEWQSSLSEDSTRERAAAAQEVSIQAPGQPDADDQFAAALGQHIDQEFSFVMGAAPATQNQFLLDSGSSCHIVRHKTGLQNYEAASPTDMIQCANGANMEIVGYGDLPVITNTGTPLTLKRVAFCPSAVSNLIGGMRLAKGGCVLELKDQEGIITDASTGKVIFRANVVSGSWLVSLRVRETVTTMKTIAMPAHEVDPLAVKWHRRLGHLNNRALQHLAKMNAVPGMPSKLGNVGFCADCVEGKMTRTSHPRTDKDSHASRPCELIHLDIFGPVRLQRGAMNDSSFGLVLTDDFTHHIWVVMLRHKADAMQVLMAFHANLKNQFPQFPISHVRSDGALEFQTHELQQYWLKNGVKHEVSPRYSPQSNGVAERTIRTIVEMTRTLLVAARLPAFFWPAAAQLAAKIRNRVPSSASPDRATPYQALYGHNPSFIELRRFGCQAWGKRPDVQRKGKFDSKALPYIYLGPAFRGASKLWDPRLQKQLIEHSVTFDEDKNGSDLLTSREARSAPGMDADMFVVDTVAPPSQSKPSVTPANIQQLASAALRRGAVPEGARITMERAAQGLPVERPDMARAAALLMAHSKLMTERARRGGWPTSVNVQGRMIEGASERFSNAETTIEELHAPEGARERQDTETQTAPEERSAPTRRSARLAGEEPDHQPLPTTSGHKRKEPGDPASSETCRMAVSPGDLPFDDPRTVSDALDRPDRDRWLEAMHAEVRSHLQRGTWRVVKAYGKPNLISAKWVFKRKMNADGSIQKYKARLVARGFTQVQGVDFDETFAPTARLQNMRLFCALCAALGLELHQIDFETAYLNAPLKNQIFMAPPEGFDALGLQIQPDDALELTLALYGLKQSGHEWHSVLREALKKIGFSQCDADPCMFVRDGGSPAILLVYVDDILVACPRDGSVYAVKNELLTLFKGTDLGPAHHCLGIRIERNWSTSTITLDQERYTEEILTRFGMADCKPARTPMCPKIVLRKASDDEPRADTKKYQAIVGSLAYLAQGTRPDIAFAVSCLSKFCADPTEAHMTAAKRVLRYLRETTSAKLVFGGNDRDYSHHGCELQGFVDADWAADRDDRRSTSGFVFTMAGGAVSWGARKQGAVALSTAEAEYIAAGVAGREAVMLKGALAATGQEIGKVNISCDNQAALHLVKNPGSHHNRSKHIDIVHHWVRNKTQEGAFAFEWIDTDRNPADAFTKPLGEAKLRQHARSIGLETSVSGKDVVELDQA